MHHTRLLFFLLLLATLAPAEEWKLVWSDEFNTPGLPDKANWDDRVLPQRYLVDYIRVYSAEAAAAPADATLRETGRSGRSHPSGR